MPNIANANYDAYCGNLPSQNIITSITSYILQELHLSALFGKEVYQYKRSDIQMQTMPSLSVYPLSINTANGIINYIGRVGFNIIIPISISRHKVTEAALVLAEGIYIALRTQDFIDYVQTKIPSLVDMSAKSRIDYSSINTDENKAWYNISGEIDYEVNYIIWMEEMKQLGVELTDICTQAALFLSIDMSQDLKENKNGNKKSS